MAQQLQVDKYHEGSGEIAKKGDAVSVHYVGMLEDGTQFDSSRERGEPISFVLGGGSVIAGWEQGIEGLRVGDKAKLIIPSDLAYGARGVPGVIPGGATLVFDVELMNVN